MGLLEEGIDRLGLPHEPGRLAALRVYLEEIERWNPRYGLVNASGDALVVRHLLDSLSALPLIRSLPHGSLADVGSGAGLPGIPLALFLDDARITLIERSGRRAAFLRNVVPLCDLARRVSVLECGLEQVDRQFQVVTLRAFAGLDEVIDPLLRITAPGGSIVAYKGKEAVVRTELDRGALKAARLVRVEVPFLEEERTLVVFSE